MSTGKIALIVSGAVAGLIAFGFLIAGGGLLLLHTTQRDADGFYTSPGYDITADGYAVTTEDIDLGAHPGDWFPAPGAIEFRVAVTPTEASEPVFVGVGPEAEVEAYLDDVQHERITRVGDDPDEVTYRSEGGTAAPAVPTDQDFWIASAEGSGTQTVTWDAEQGVWALAIMNADGSPGIDVTASAGADVGLLLPIGIGLLIAGLIVGLIAAALLMAGIASSDRETVARAPEPVPTLYPVRVEGELDPELSRWMWLVKWFLAIPHVIVLAFLWAAFAILTVVAGFAILFTGRYPRAIFDFNVGVMRWTWRVTYYAYGVLGTDRYPPFTLAADPDHPTAFDVEYPEQLSRGLVLVKWWLLAIPHYLVIGFFTGGILSWTWDVGDPEGWQAATGGGLIGILVFVAAVVLLVTGRYPRGLFDLVMGLQRWVYRVMAYAALMTDEYPPFRLDTGGSEPPRPTPTSPAGPPDTDAEREPVPA